jgi:hypothetical protein
LAASPILVLSEETALRRETFFKVVFDRAHSGYLCIARRVAGKGAFEERFFQWPDDLATLGEYINESVMNHDVWFCPMLFDAPSRKKEHVDICTSVWADLDTCPPEQLLIEPTVVIESSPNRYQALWLLVQPAEPLEAEDASKKVAYFHAEAGADKSGWDLTQLLRVPFTLNYKYAPPATVQVKAAGDSVALVDFTVYPVVTEDISATWPFPDSIEDSQTLLDQYKNDIDQTVWPLLQLEPREDWSKALWNLEMLLSESGLSREDVFSIARDAKCNKYRRDGRSEKLLWREVCKAWDRVRERRDVIPDTTVYKNPDLLSDGDLRAAEQDRTFVEDYVDWAKGVGDAAEVYHHAGAFIALSCLLAGSVRLQTSFGPIAPNLWFLLLADTTLTRKSTALDLAVDLLTEVDSDIILATDGSIEGLFSALAGRPGRPSLFLRDEFSGFIEVITKRDYYAGMPETLTKMYDGRFQKRQLRREIIEVKEPVLILFAGGIKSKILSLLGDEFVYSGFLPRFVFVTAKSNLGKLRPLGPPNDRTISGRELLRARLATIKARYQREIEITTGSIKIPVQDRPDVQLTPDAWKLYNNMELRLLESGIKSLAQDMMTPTMDRLAKSGLKASILIAGSRMQDGIVTVTEGDILKAFQYVTQWREFAMEVMSNIGISAQEKHIELIYATVKRSPGVARSELMRTYHMTKREADLIFDTLEQRGLIARVKTKGTERLTALL